MNTDDINTAPLRHGISQVKGKVVALEQRGDTAAGNPQWFVTLDTGGRFLTGEDHGVASHIHEPQFAESEHLFEVVAGINIRRVIWTLKPAGTWSERMRQAAEYQQMSTTMGFPVLAQGSPIPTGTHQSGHVLDLHEEREYIVRWEIELTATDPVAAAREALSIQKDPDSIASYFEVFDVADEDVIPVDLLDAIDYGRGEDA